MQESSQNLQPVQIIGKETLPVLASVEQTISTQAITQKEQSEHESLDSTGLYKGQELAAYEKTKIQTLPDASDEKIPQAPVRASEVASLEEHVNDTVIEEPLHSLKPLATLRVMMIGRLSRDRAYFNTLIRNNGGAVTTKLTNNVMLPINNTHSLV